MKNESRQLRKRKIWMKECFRLREKIGMYKTILFYMKNDQQRFFNFTRMNLKQYLKLFNGVKEEIIKSNIARQPIPPEIKFAITIRFVKEYFLNSLYNIYLFINFRYLASGESLRSLSHSFLVHESTISIFLPVVLDSIWNYLSSLVFPKLCEDKWLQIEKGFAEKGFPHCIGAIDGKHCRIQVNSIL